MADQVVGMLHQVDGKVNDMRNSIESDPESLTDKLVKFALPGIAALLAGKLFQSFWSGLVRKRNGGVDNPEEDQERALPPGSSSTFCQQPSSPLSLVCPSVVPRL